MLAPEKRAAIHALMAREMAVATGCTEPVAVALAAATARKLAGGIPVSVEVKASVNIIKNAMAAGIPGTSLAGMDYAAALGALSGDPEKRLQVLSALPPDSETKARNLVTAGKVKVVQAETEKKLFIDVTVRTEDSWGRAVIEDRHDGITIKENASGRMDSGAAGGMADQATGGPGIDLTLDDMVEFAETEPLENLGLVKESLRLNGAISDEGLRLGQGLGVGKMIRDQIADGVLADDIMNHAMSRTAAGTDARMAGSPSSVMSNSGSGNQGISATLPVVAVWEKLGQDGERLVRAATISNLVTIYSKRGFGKLSALCGVVLAASGASCGITWLLGGSREAIKMSIHNVIGNVSGMVCDGAKSDCALKVSTCTAAAVQASFLAMRGKSVTPVEGIIGKDADASIANLARLGNEASPTIDPLLIDIMLNKEK